MNATGVAVGAVQRYQSEAPPIRAAWSGSPSSRLAATFVPAMVPDGPLRTVAAARLSLATPSVRRHDSVREVPEPKTRATAIETTSPAVTPTRRGVWP